METKGSEGAAGGKDALVPGGEDMYAASNSFRDQLTILAGGHLGESCFKDGPGERQRVASEVAVIRYERDGRTELMPRTPSLLHAVGMELLLGVIQEAGQDAEPNVTYNPERHDQLQRFQLFAVIVGDDVRESISRPQGSSVLEVVDKEVGIQRDL